MEHLIVCREYPPAPYPPGGIGTYTRHIVQLLADAGETVHVIAQRWEGAPLRVSESCGGRIIIHRVALDEQVDGTAESVALDKQILPGLVNSECPTQAFSWQVARVAERLIRTGNIDVIEAPEWEAPLYYLQLRRALGLGPEKQPPCLVHFHSPSELIFQHNEWDRTLTDFEPLRRLEEYSVLAADTWVCPSKYLARGAERLYGLHSGAVNVIPYPLGDTPTLDRGPEVWKRNSIAYVGRLELRKGVVEWVDAAVSVAKDQPTATFEFFGSTTSLTGGIGQSVQDYLSQRIPRDLQQRFRFHGTCTRSQLLESLAQIPVAVVPSRWENLPYTCIEAMATGLPVLVSPTGGMAELVSDRVSGWVASDGTAEGLAVALRRVIATPPDQRAAMGQEASRTVRRVCGSDAVLKQHIDLRDRVARTRAQRSVMIPVKQPATDSVRPSTTAATGTKGITVVISCRRRPHLLEGCVESILNQSVPPRDVILVINEGARIEGNMAARFQQQHWQIIHSTEPAKEIANRLVADASALVFLNEGTRLHRDYVSTVESVFARHPRVGRIACLMNDGGTSKDLDVPASSVSLRDFTTLDPSCMAMRAEALSDEMNDQKLSGERENPLWTALTFPALLATTVPVRRTILNRFSNRKRYSAVALAQHASARVALHWFLSASLSEKVRWIRGAASKPRAVAQWVMWQVRGAKAGCL